MKPFAPRSFVSLLVALYVASGTPAFAQPAVTAPKKPAEKRVATDEFPVELVKWKLREGNPVFRGAGPGHWDVKIRERGWIMPDGDGYRMWYTGYEGTRQSTKLLGMATSPDGINWTRSPKNPLVRDHWIEDMTVVRHGETYYMFAEGREQNHSVMLTSQDGVDWKLQGELDVRAADGQAPARRPCGTPTVWIEDGKWYLFYEWHDLGVWLATTRDPHSLVWTNVQDNPVLELGPAAYDKGMIAMDQVIKHRGVYYAIYHGSGISTDKTVPRTWNTDIARSTDLVRWKKYAGNPIVEGDRSSGIVVPVGGKFRLYTMHDHVDVFESGK